MLSITCWISSTKHMIEIGEIFSRIYFLFVVFSFTCCNKMRRKLGMTGADASMEHDQAELQHLIQEWASRRDAKLKSDAKSAVKKISWLWWCGTLLLGSCSLTHRSPSRLNKTLISCSNHRMTTTNSKVFIKAMRPTRTRFKRYSKKWWLGPLW